jgi:hypothetical protein
MICGIGLAAPSGQIEVGMLGINYLGILTPESPFD